MSEIVLEANENAESTNTVEQMFNSNFSNDCGNVVPYLLVPDQPFAKFDMSKLDRDILPLISNLQIGLNVTMAFYPTHMGA